VAETGQALTRKAGGVNERLLLAARGKPVDATPVWIMRQAGRYLPEYRAIREKVAFLDLCKTPDLAAEVTVQPVSRLGVDAAIIFSDILIPVEAMGLTLELDDRGPRLPNPVASEADVRRLGIPDPEASTGYVAEAIRKAYSTGPGRLPLNHLYRLQQSPRIVDHSPPVPEPVH